MNQFATIAEALDEIRQGRMVILVDDEDRENEGDIIFSAQHVTPEAINFMAKFGRGLICLALPAEQIDRFELPLMTANNQAKFNTAFTVSVGAAKGITTGISTHDRALTIQVLMNPEATRADIALPGHVFPLRAVTGGVLVRAGHTEGGVDLTQLAGLQPGAVICEILNDDGSMARLNNLQEFARIHQLKIISIQDLIKYRKQNEILVQELASAKLPLELYGDFNIKTFACDWDPLHHIALISNQLDISKPVWVRIHSECLTGDLFGSLRCDCGWQLQTSLTKIAQQQGIFIYLRQEGRGIGLTNKIKAYALQEQGLDTVEANQQLGFSADQRDYTVAAHMLRYLNIRQVQLLTNNPKKLAALTDSGITIVQHQALEMPTCVHRHNYLKAKRDKLGHLLNLLKPN